MKIHKQYKNKFVTATTRREKQKEKKMKKNHWAGIKKL